MPLADDLKEHARELLKEHFERSVARDPNRPPKEILLRRAVSASYYSVFHLLSAAVAEQMSPKTPPGLRGRTQRALDHGAMANVATQFAKSGGSGGQPIDIGLSEPVSDGLARVAKNFVNLQEARYLADYDILDVANEVQPRWALECGKMADQVFQDWSAEKGTDGGNVFLAALMIGNRWKKAESKR